MPLTSAQRQKLRSIAHHKKTLLQVGDKGITENVIAELDRLLTDHELVKVSIAGQDRLARKALGEQLCAATASYLVQQIGRVTIVYRAAEPPVIAL